MIVCLVCLNAQLQCCMIDFLEMTPDWTVPQRAGEACRFCDRDSDYYSPYFGTESVDLTAADDIKKRPKI